MDIYMVGEAAIELGLTNQGVLARIKRGQIAAIKRGGVWTIPRPELNRFKKNRLASARTYYVYLHKTPQDQVFYVGRSRSKRLTDFAKGRHNHQYQDFVDKNKLQGFIRFEVVGQGLSERESAQLEKETISLYRSMGHPLTNYSKLK